MPLPNLLLSEMAIGTDFDGLMVLIYMIGFIVLVWIVFIIVDLIRKDYQKAFLKVILMVAAWMGLGMILNFLMKKH